MVRENYGPDYSPDSAFRRMEEDVMAILDLNNEFDRRYSERQRQLAQIDVDMSIDGNNDAGKLY